MIEMVRSLPQKKNLYTMKDGSTIEAENIEEALKIYNSKNAKN